MGNFRFLALLGVTLLVAPLPTHAQAPSTPASFKGWLDRQVDFESPEGIKSSGMFSSDGATKISSQKFADTGKWRLTNDSVCVQWKKLRGGKENCFVIVPEGMQFLLVFKETGSVSSKVTVH